MEFPQIDLYDFLTESELQQYYNGIKNELKITNAAQFKYATDEDLKHIGLSRPEIRRLRKYYEKHFPHGYLSKIKRLLQAPTTNAKREDGLGTTPIAGNDSPAATTPTAKCTSPGRVSNNKHIIPADSITVNKQLGTGEFGIVQQGVWTNGTERIQVAIKCLCRERMQSNPMEFLKEAAIMHSIEHENIVRLYGVVLTTDSLMLVTELAHLRSLLECLKDPGLRVSFLTITTLCEFAMQICNGMRYLEQKRLIHRDLAARNILVFNKNVVKISDFGLSRALGVGKDYYKTNFNVNLKLPIAWCAPECINYLRFTNASDVWAYGVCLWEMFSYGFQPWAALTGLQILEAIDAPNYQRLEQPDCCPSEYYALMMKCWQDDPAKRPKFSEIYEQLPDMKPEQLKAVVNCLEPKKDHLAYRQGDIITVLERNTGTPFWKGVLATGTIGYFNPSNTVTFLEGLPSSNKDSFIRTSDNRYSKRKLRTEMISKPQNDFKHTGHVGIDGVSFGDIAFLGSSQNYNHVPRQIVTPYKPSEDIEQTPLLLPPTPTSPDSLQTASGYFSEAKAIATAMNPTFIPSAENTPKNLTNSEQDSFEFLAKRASNIANSNPFNTQFQTDDMIFALQNNNYDLDGKALHSKNSTDASNGWRAAASRSSAEMPHEYHEISDDEINSDKLDFGPSLLDEINSMFGSISANSGEQQTKSAAFEQYEKNNFAEMSEKLSGKNNEQASSNKHTFSLGTSSCKKKSGGTVKQISVKDEKILNQAIEIATEISARSMIDLVSDHPQTVQSPKRKFSFRFPHLSSNSSGDKSSTAGLTSSPGSSGQAALHANVSPYAKKKNFTEELKSLPDMQAIIGEEGREAYNSLIERKATMDIDMSLCPAAQLLRQLDTNEFSLTSAKTLPRRSLLLHQSTLNDVECRQKIQTNMEMSEPNVRPMTLPSRGSANRMRKSIELNYNPPALEQRPASEQAANATCESPNYVSGNTSYTFGEQSGTQPVNADTNPIPLPPREGKKQVKSNEKRHVRKYPLIIPANGVQRTLNKVINVEQGTYNNSSSNTNGNSQEPHTIEVVAAIRVQNAANESNKNYENVPNTSGMEPPTTPPHAYQNLENFKKVNSLAIPSTDTASVQFESILEDDSNKGNVLASPDVADGFYNFSIHKEHYNKSHRELTAGLYVNEDELRNLDIEGNHKVSTNEANGTTTTEQQQQQPNASKSVTNPKCTSSSSNKQATSGGANNELSENVLFQKVRASINQAASNCCKDTTQNTNAGTPLKNTKNPTDAPQTEGEYLGAATLHLAASNSVSCEDLLEFANQKPKGCERGVDSDEVRIMMKVLGKACTPTRCLTALEFINWDIHKAIKLVKLQNILNNTEIDLSNVCAALQTNDWDLHMTAIKLKHFTRNNA